MSFALIEHIMNLIGHIIQKFTTFAMVENEIPFVIAIPWIESYR